MALARQRHQCAGQPAIERTRRERRYAGRLHTAVKGLVVSRESFVVGAVTRFVDVKARSGALSASGEATVANGLVDATLAVDLVDGVVGVPLRITGPTRKVTVSVPPAALAGAAVGTVVAPGVGTAVGARLGAAIGQLFGGDTKSPSASGAAGKPSAPSAAKAPPGGPRAR